MTSGYEKSTDYGGRPVTKLRLFVVFAVIVLLALLGLWLNASSGEANQIWTVTGAAEIVDGDTVTIGAQTVRLHGIDAPEAGQRCQRANGTDWRCGREAINHLAGLVAGRELTCIGDAFDEFDRLIAVCTAGGADIGARMARDGMAWAFVRFSQDYVAEEAEARTARRGIWRGPAQPAWEFRAERWQLATQQSPTGCPIKGNISDNGRIYHAPWSPWYSRTRINEANGERWFCSEREALDAGWRAPYWR
ncbi:MAG: thermonuclease family protein [Hyphomicrobiales bacterium]